MPPDVETIPTLPRREKRTEPSDSVTIFPERTTNELPKYTWLRFVKRAYFIKDGEKGITQTPGTVDGNGDVEIVREWLPHHRRTRQMIYNRHDSRLQRGIAGKGWQP